MPRCPSPTLESLLTHERLTKLSNIPNFADRTKRRMVLGIKRCSSTCSDFNEAGTTANKYLTATSSTIVQCLSLVAFLKHSRSFRAPWVDRTCPSIAGRRGELSSSRASESKWDWHQGAGRATRLLGTRRRNLIPGTCTRPGHAPEHRK